MVLDVVGAVFGERTRRVDGGGKAIIVELGLCVTYVGR